VKMADVGRVLMALAIQIVEEEEADCEQVMMAVAQIGVAELLELEDGVSNLAPVAKIR